MNDGPQVTGGPEGSSGPEVAGGSQGRGGPQVTGIVLAGGDSTRMGQDKALIPIAGLPMVVRVAERLRQVLDRVLFVVRDPERYRGLGLGLPLVTDRLGNEPHSEAPPGPLAGLHAGLLAAGTPFGLVVSCDQPELPVELVRYLAEQASSRASHGSSQGPLAAAAGSDLWDALVPRPIGRPQPLLAVYSARCAAVAEDLLRRGEHRMRALLEEVRVRYVEDVELARFGPVEQLFLNLNTPEDLRRYQELLRQEQEGSLP